MSRTVLCVITAGTLAALSLGVMVVRYRVLGDEVRVPTGPGTWRVTMAVQGRSQYDGKLMTATPLDFGRQHVLRETCRSAELLDKPPDARHPDRRVVLWSHRAGVPAGSFRAHYEFYCVTDVHRPSSSMARLAKSLYAPPKRGEYLDTAPPPGLDVEEVSNLTRRLTAGLERPADRAEALFRHVDQEITKEPSVPGQPISAAECLHGGSGDAGGKSRLLVALLRNRGIPARMVNGLILSKDREQRPHHWVEAWVGDRWLAMCPFFHRFGGVPGSYLVFNFGDHPLVRGRHVGDLEYAYLVERVSPDEVLDARERSGLRRALMAVSLFMLPPTEQRLVEFLLLLPVAALIVCLFRNVIGLTSFGTFGPALVGLAFRDLHSLPGILVFVSILLVGWLLRRGLDSYHLLQAPRVAFMLSLVVVLLIGTIVAANLGDVPATRYVSLFPMIILTGMIERFWALEAEDSTSASFKTLLVTILISATIALVLSVRAVVTHLFRYPETLGLIMAGQLLLGRYTGYRLTELFRFREFLRDEADGPLAA
jgi:7 transmembrane helices usually fused to an inactive transglutaminase/Transglutaminase-like superfamily